jgi:outer membrane protein assembly factor BamB
MSSSVTTTRGTCPSNGWRMAVTLAALGVAFGGGFAHAQGERELAKTILEETGVKGGFVVHLGCGDGRLTSALRANERYQVHGLDRDATNVENARQRLLKAGVYGDVAVDRLDGSLLPYVENLVNLVVAEDLGDTPMNEVLRVLAPNGVAYVKQDGLWVKTIKPRPDNIDEWTHYLHDASGNAVAHDDVVGPPKHLQWVGSPRWSRHHDRMASMSAMVSANGRVFYIMDEGSRVSIQLPSKWMLVARDAFNGMILWKKPLKDWNNQLWPLKSGPTQLARRLVANGDHVYVTLGISEPLSEIDAATGRVIRVLKDSGSCEEVIVHDGTVYALANKEPWELADYAPQFNTGDQARVARDYKWNEKPRQLMAFTEDSGSLLWKKEATVSPLSITADKERMYFHDGLKVTCLNRSTGEELWSSEATGRRPAFTMNFGPKMVIHDDIVIFAGGDRKMRAMNSKTGQQLWEAAHEQGGYQSPEDLLVVNGLVWSAPTTSGRDSGIWHGRDVRTGELKVQFPPNVDTYWFHHRCYIAKATDRFLMPSRTGIEFVDYDSKNWDINHWVRGGCLYGVMPCNGLVYAPPHNCFCYPEAKLFGMNALAPASVNRQPRAAATPESRIERGPAYDQVVNLKSQISNPKLDEWPTYRRDNARSGYAATPVSTKLQQTWQTEIGGRISAPIIAAGKLFVAQIDTHTMYAVDIDSGKTLWSYTTGGRVDSPPTYHSGTVLFGSADGWVYCLDADSGRLAWRSRAAPDDQRLMAFEQLESVWPVHGNVLVRDNAAYFVAGRSNFLDGGLRFCKVALTPEPRLEFEKVIDDIDPETGKEMQTRLQVLQMPVGLPDVLTDDGKFIYMRSQQFDYDGNRIDIGPHSGDAPKQGSVQRGETAHLFSPSGFLDDTWFHRSYWVYGRSFAGGHNGYYQAGKYAPAGRLLVFDDQNVYGYGRKPEYYKWTTILEHQLFAADKQPPEIPNPVDVRRGNVPAASGSMIKFAITKSLDPTGTPLAVEAWVKADKPNGVVVARGGPANGYALTVEAGQPKFHVRAENVLSTVSGTTRIVGQWTHLIGVLTADNQLQLYVNGKQVGTAKGTGFITSDPQQGLEIGGDDGTAVGEYKSPYLLTGTIDEVRVYHSTLTVEEVAARFAAPEKATIQNAKLMLACSFEKGNAADESGNKNDGQLGSVTPATGKIGAAMAFTGTGAAAAPAGGNAQDGQYYVQHKWTKDIPLFVRAMIKTGDTLFVCGPPDMIDEVESFARLAARDPRINELLADQDSAMEGHHGALLRAVSATNGETLSEYNLPSLPAWDGLATSAGRLYLTTADGKVICFGGP